MGFQDRRRKVALTVFKKEKKESVKFYLNDATCSLQTDSLQLQLASQ